MGRDAAQCHLDKFKAEIAEYEMLTSHDSQAPIVLELDDIDYLPDILIKARIAAKLSEKELGALCGCTEEQIKRYEKDDYQSASFLDFRRVIFALNIKIQSGKFLVELDTLERTPITIEDLRSSKSRAKSQAVVNESKTFQPALD
jgi:transcriptional regulator with XRE-family HTH domain